MSQEITFGEVLIKPQYSEVLSRKQVNTAVKFGSFDLTLPVVSANMRDITGPKMACAMCEMGGLGILHRWNTIDEAVEEYNESIRLINSSNPTSYSVGVSVGVKEQDRERFIRLYEAGARLFCIDVSHGDHVLMKNMISYMKKGVPCPQPLIIIAGNVATPEGAGRLIEWGADIVKVGIGPGAACKTRSKAGVGVPQLSAIMNVRKVLPNIKMISDGGIKHAGDVAKALVYADAVMVGNFIAGSSETPGSVYEGEDGQYYKMYGGSASGENKNLSGQKNQFVEGMVKKTPFRGHVKYMLQTIKEGIQMACSYSGCHTLYEFKKKAILVEISTASQRESKII
ncbi:MAG: guanosine monophosphate reductase [Methanomassiliicoccales archaeon]|jgi:IMP dehydrogenase